MSSDSELLQRACDRILDLETPAFIKDGGLRYIAVNDAFARLHGAGREAFVGRTYADFPGEVENAETDEKQRRSLVFGSDELVRCGSFELRVERFLTNDDRAFLLGLFEPVAFPVLRSGAAPIAGKAQNDEGGVPGKVAIVPTPGMLGTALDLLDAGVGIFDASDLLLNFNEHFNDYLRTQSVVLTPGMSLRSVLEQLYDGQVRPDLDEVSAGNSRRDWIDERIAVFAKSHSQSIESLPDGRWLRCVNKRLENGWLVLLRQDVTEFKIQELRLGKQIEEAEIFRAAFENLPVAVFLRDGQRRLLYGNAAYEEILGGDRRQFIGKTDEEMFPAASPRFRSENERLLHQGGELEKTSEIRLSESRSMSAITRLVRISTPAGEPYLVGSITDVTQVRAAQREAERLHQQLQTILNSMSVGVAILDHNLIFEYVNPRLHEMWMLEDPQPIDFLGKSYRTFLEYNYKRGTYRDAVEDFDSFYKSRIEALVSSEELPPIEFVTSKGRSLVISRSHLAEGKLLLNYFDITSMRKREQEVREARAALERHGALMDDATNAMSQGLLILRDGQIIFSNAAVSKILQIPEDLPRMGRAWNDTFAFLAERGDFGSQKDAIALMEEWNTFRAHGQSFGFTLHIHGKNWIAGEVMLSERGNWLAVFTDITETRQREAELKSLLHRAEAADRAKSEFLANMSHEIRTPMNGVLGMAELLAKSVLDARQKTFTDIIVKSGNALLTIINDILDFSKIDAGQMNLRKAPFDPIEAIEDVATLLSSAASEKDIELLVRGASVRHTVMGDAGRFRQIITNLVGNAVKFTDKGQIFIDVEAVSPNADQVVLSIRIEDTGMGIAKDKLQSIFEKFSQVDTSSTRRHEGTGLGLAITAGLVNLFGGRIAVDSTIGKGTVFTLEIPFQIASTRNINDTTVQRVHGARVLVIDDNAINRRILTEQLAMWQFDAAAAESGQEGLAFLNAAADLAVRIDAVILDYHMPEMNGIQVARIMRNDERLRDVPIIFLTSLDTLDEEPLLESLNIQAHLMKPARSNILRTTINDVVRSARMRSQAGGPDTFVKVPAYVERSEEQRDGDAPPAVGLDVLVAEDNEVNQIVFTQILQATGLHFRIVGNGADAVQAWQSDKPQLILMDVSMPVMNGHQATRRIREIEMLIGGHVPIIGVTAHALDSDRELCLAAGMDDYLSKPISPEMLEAKIHQWRDVSLTSDALHG